MGIPRQVEYQVTHYIRRDVAFNTNNIANGVLIGTVPAGSKIVDVHIYIDTAFNGTTPTLQGGTTGTGTNLFTNTDSVPGTVGEKEAASAAGQARGLIFTADTDLFASFTGAGATTGAATVIVEFVPLTNGG